MTQPPPPMLLYANDAQVQAQVHSIIVLRRCVLVTAIVYYSTLILWMFLPREIGQWVFLFSYGVQLVMIVFVVWLGFRLQSLVTGIALAFLVGVPCAGPCIPFYLVAQASEHLRDLAKRGVAEANPAVTKNVILLTGAAL
jgi:hypothetical protein